jgi:putative spermidine/putrescine transport system substrate-binding protein
MTRSKSRREVLLGAAALAGTAALPSAASSGQEKGRIVVGTWGGDYARLLHKNI